jgi:hypothetical protein
MPGHEFVSGEEGEGSGAEGKGAGMGGGARENQVLKGWSAAGQ